MTQKLITKIPRNSDSYEIEIGEGLLNSQAQYLSTLASKFAIITHDKIAPLYGQVLYDSLCAAGLKAHLFSFPGGEQNKTRATKEQLEDQLFEKGFGRDSCIIALGGGVVTDLVGYLAATYCRGVPFVTIPTSLMGMVDAAIGGKTGVNVPYGKNLVGCIYQPKKVIIDPATLRSLPKRELVGGVVEMIKHGIILNSQLFDYLEANSNRILELDPAVVEKAIFESCRIKVVVIEEDEKEQGKRRLLNFGHTIGHAIEKLSQYSIPHGEAVAIGILVESYISVQLGILSQKSFERIKDVLVQYQVPLCLPSKYPEQAFIASMSLDKKSLNGRPRFIIVDEIGSSLPYDSSYCISIEEVLLKQAVQWMNDVF